MNIILLILSLILIPAIIGCGIVKTYITIKTKISKADSYKQESALCRLSVYFTSGTIILIIFTGALNALTVFMNMSISKAGKLFCIGLGIILLLSILMTALNYIISKKHKKSDANQKPTYNSSVAADNQQPIITNKVLPLMIIAIVIAIAQIVTVSLGKNIPYSGDQTLETVVSFINTDYVYSVDPLTGLPYLNGYPFRLSLQCLPFLYSLICKFFALEPIRVVWNIMPAFWLVCGYLSIIRISNSLFKKMSLKLLMLIFFEFLLWCSNVAYGATGFNVFHVGYSAMTVLELLLIYWTFDMLISQNIPVAILAIIVEPMVASTKFGIGACFFITILYLIISKLPFIKRLTRILEEKEGNNDGKA